MKAQIIYYKQVLTFVFGCLLFKTAAIAQGDSPCSATSLTVSSTCSNTNGTTVGATYSSNAANFGAPSCASPGAADVWYSFVAPANGTITINTTAGTMTDSGISLYSATNCSTGYTELACDDDSGTGTMSMISQTGLTSGATYYIRVWQYSSGTGTFSICVTTPPANDNCSGATALTVNGNTTCTTSTSGSVSGATSSGNSLGACGGTADDDVWYSFVAASTTHYINLNNVAGSTTDLYHIVYSGTCGALGAEILCSDPNSSTLTGLTIGNTYYVRIYTFTATTGQTTTFDVCITSPNPPPSNDNCAGASSVTVNTSSTCSSFTSATVENATASGNSLGACDGTADDDVWFSFVATETNLSINLINITGSDDDLYHTVYSGTCGALGAEILCSDPNGSSLTSLTVGNTYYLRVYTWTSTAGQTTDFDVCIIPTPDPPTNVTCNLMDPICSGSATIFTAQADGSSAAAGPDYDCLLSQPNPSWYYLEIDNPGLLSIDITAQSDVDFAIWGPYANLTAAKAACTSYPTPLDCSFSASEIEQANVPGTLNGEVYVLLVTNYASVVQTITLDQSPSAVATTNCSIVPLPIELSSFTVKEADQKIQLDWITESENNSSSFVVEKSVSGKFWETIGVVRAKENSTSRNYYRFVDEFVEFGTQYYRLKQVDKDGQFTYTSIQSVTIGFGSEISLYPVPAKEQVTVFVGEMEVDELILIGVLGENIPVEYKKQGSEYIIDTKSLKKGIYTVVLNGNGQTIMKKMIKG